MAVKCVTFHLIQMPIVPKLFHVEEAWQSFFPPPAQNPVKYDSWPLSSLSLLEIGYTETPGGIF